MKICVLSIFYWFLKNCDLCTNNWFSKQTGTTTNSMYICQKSLRFSRVLMPWPRDWHPLICLFLVSWNQSCIHAPPEVYGVCKTCSYICICSREDRLFFGNSNIYLCQSIQIWFFLNILALFYKNLTNCRCVLWNFGLLFDCFYFIFFGFHTGFARLVFTSKPQNKYIYIYIRKLLETFWTEKVGMAVPVKLFAGWAKLGLGRRGVRLEVHVELWASFF